MMADPFDPLEEPSGGLDELYALYVETSQRTRANILERTEPGALRDHLLSAHRTLPKERFEARLLVLAGQPHELAAVIRSLRSVA